MRPVSNILDTDRQNRIKHLLSDALELEPASREDFVRTASMGDTSIAEEVRVLIRAHERSGHFIPDPTIDGLDACGQTIGQYRLIHRIGEGGFGSVYLAQQREPIARQVALKIIKPGMDTRQVIARFEAERQVLAMMKHPGVAAVFDAGATSEGRPYFVMEFVEGAAITDYCDQHRLSVEKRLSLFIDVCGAVQHAHTKGIIHRDLKPSNLLVAGDAGVALPKVIDFGIAKATGARLGDLTVSTDGRSHVGTPQYMSPEQVHENPIDIDTRADVYSLGVVLYELLAGATPFDGERLRSAGRDGWQRIIRDEEPPKPSTRLSTLAALDEIAARRNSDPRRLPARISGELDWITLKSMDKDRERRYRSVAELADDLRRHLRHEPVLAGPPSAGYRVRKFLRRHRVGVLASSLVILAALGGSAGLTVGMMQARQSASRARDAAQQAEAVNDFMQEILTSASPEADGADVRLVEVMDGASAVAGLRFADYPLQEAQVRDLLGSVYGDLSACEKAKQQFKRAMDLWFEHAGPDDRRAITSERLYVGSALDNQQVAEVEGRLPGLLERATRIFGPDDLATLDVQRSIGIAHMLRGQTDEAERLFLDVRERLLAHGDDDALQVRTLRSLIRVCRMKAFGADDATHAALMVRIEQLASEQVERADRAFGNASLVGLDARVKWAEVLADQRRYAEAVQVIQAVLESASDRIDACHHLRLDAQQVLAEAAHRRGDSASAADLELKIIDCLRSRENPMALITAMSDSLPILDRGERWVEGEALTREFIDRLNAMGGGHGDMIFDGEIWIARFVSMQGRLLESDIMFRELIAREGEAGPTGRVIARLHLYYGSNLGRMGEFEESESQLRAAADMLDDFRQGTRNSNPDDVLIEFIELYSAWGKPEQADEYRALREQTLANLPVDPS